MKSFSIWCGAVAAVIMLAGTSVAADTIFAGKVKTATADNKTFVVTDAAGKDQTFQLAATSIVNRDGKESKGGLKVGDTVNVSHDNGATAWTAQYILVQDGANKNCTLVHGEVKSYNPASKQLIFTDDNAKNLTFSMGQASVQLNGSPSRMEDIRTGDHALIIVETTGTTAALRNVIVARTN